MGGQMSNTINIYELVAWSIEWEGSLQVNRRSSRIGTYSYQTYIDINNSNIELLKEFKRKINFGKISNGYLHSENRSKIYRWSMNRQEIEEHLPKILPYLIEKYRQGELLLEALSILKPKKYTSKLSYQEKRELYTDNDIHTLNSIYWECRKLNEKIKIKPTDKDIFMMNMSKRGH
jgi:hypothetical protein